MVLFMAALKDREEHIVKGVLKGRPPSTGDGGGGGSSSARKPSASAQRARAWHVPPSVVVDTRSLVLPPSQQGWEGSLEAYARASGRSMPQVQHERHEQQQPSDRSFPPSLSSPQLSPFERHASPSRWRGADTPSSQPWWLGPPSDGPAFRERPVIQDRRRLSPTAVPRPTGPSESALIRTLSPPPLSLRTSHDEGVGPPLSPPRMRTGAVPINHFAIEPLKHLSLTANPVDAYAPLPPHPGWHLTLSPGAPPRNHVKGSRGEGAGTHAGVNAGVNAGDDSLSPTGHTPSVTRRTWQCAAASPSSTPPARTTHPAHECEPTPPVHPTVHARVVAAREQEARRRRFRQISHGTPPIYQPKTSRGALVAARPNSAGPGAMAFATPPPPNYSYVGYVSAEGLDERLLSQHIGRAAAKRGGNRGNAPPPTKWAAEGLRNANREHAAAESELRIVAVHEGSESAREQGYLHWDDHSPHELVPYTKQLLSRGQLTGDLYSARWESSQERERPMDCCTFFARLCRWPCASDELKRDGMAGRTGGETPTWLGALQKAHRKVIIERDGGGIDYRQVI